MNAVTCFKLNISTFLQDLLRGDVALLDAAKKGCLARVQKLCTPDNINCRDQQGRNSTPLHLAAGYNNYEVIVCFVNYLIVIFHSVLITYLKEDIFVVIKYEVFLKMLSSCFLFLMIFIFIRSGG